MLTCLYNSYNKEIEVSNSVKLLKQILWKEVDSCVLKQTYNILHYIVVDIVVDIHQWLIFIRLYQPLII